jgi:uncharacterized membrane protein YcjF (UPF0283 family)
MNVGIASGTALFVLGVVLAIIQLWFAPFSGELFIKLEMTIAALFLIVCVVAFVAREYREDKTTRSGDRLDD